MKKAKAVREEMVTLIERMSDKTNTNVFVFGNPQADEKAKTKLRKAAKRIWNYYSITDHQVKVN